MDTPPIFFILRLMSICIVFIFWLLWSFCVDVCFYFLWSCSILWQFFCLHFWRLLNYFQMWLQYFIISRAMFASSDVSTSHQHLLESMFFIIAILVEMAWHLIVALIWISLITTDLLFALILSFHILRGHWYFFLGKIYIQILCPF